MVAAKQAAPVTPDIEPDADVTVAPETWEWDTVREQVPIGVVFDTIGDVFIGRFEKKHHVNREPNANGEDQSFDLYVFTGRNGLPYSLPNSYAMDEAYDDNLFTIGDWTRITYIKDVKTGRKQNDMKDLRIEVRK